jgi:hypothetical protein
LGAGGYRDNDEAWFEDLTSESSRLAASRTSSTTCRESGASPGERLVGSHSACGAVIQPGDSPGDLASPRFLGMNVWQTGETLRQAKGYTSPLLFRDEIHGASAFRKASRWGPHTAGSEWVPWPRVSLLVGIST